MAVSPGNSILQKKFCCWTSQSGLQKSMSPPQKLALGLFKIVMLPCSNLGISRSIGSVKLGIRELYCFYNLLYFSFILYLSRIISAYVFMLVNYIHHGGWPSWASNQRNHFRSPCFNHSANSMCFKVFSRTWLEIKFQSHATKRTLINDTPRSLK